MGVYRGHLKQLDRLDRLAWEEAKRLRCTAVGPETFVLAILHPQAPESLAAQALGDCGIDREAIAQLVMRQSSDSEIQGGPQLNPAAYQLKSLAEGIAAGRGDPQVTPEHLLLAFLWDPDHSGQLEHLGSSREQLQAKLADLGTKLPRAELPVCDPRRWGPRVDVSLDELWILLRELPYVMPQGAQLRFNHDHKTGWLGATEGVDLAVYAPRALDRHRRQHQPPETDQH